jgi:hypothetical protein
MSKSKIVISDLKPEFITPLSAKEQEQVTGGMRPLDSGGSAGPILPRLPSPSPGPSPGV